jgi:hypothetical protein
MNYAITILEQKKAELVRMRDNLTEANNRILKSLEKQNDVRNNAEILEEFMRDYEGSKKALNDKIDSLIGAISYLSKMEGGE